MTPNKQTVQKYMDAFARTDHAEILSCLTDDVEWLSRMIEEHDVVVAEGSVRAARRDGGILNAVFCDVFVMHDAKIRHLTSYLMEVQA